MAHPIAQRIYDLRHDVVGGGPLPDDLIWVHQAELLAMAPEKIEAEILPACISLAETQLAHHGWFMPKAKQTLAECLWAIAKSAALPAANTTTRHTSRSRAGVDFIRTHFSSYWTAGKVSVVESAHRPDVLQKVLSYRLGLNKKRETFNISLSEIRRGFISGRHTVSMFKPAVAARIYTKWTPENVPVVWDPSGGFGARLLGFFAAFPHGTYFANEPASETYRDLNQLALRVVESMPDAGAYIGMVGSEVQGPPHPVGLVFTSPPYFNREQYFDEPGQCWRDYPSKEEWLQRYLMPTMQHAHEKLVSHGHMVLNVSQDLSEAFMETAHDVGFDLVAQESLMLPVDHFQRARGATTPRFEPILVWKKRPKTQGTSDTEQWKPVVGTNGRYFVSNQGRIRSHTKSKEGKIILGHTLASGYRAVGITPKSGGASTTRLLHRLVVETFIGPPPSKAHTDVRHLDGNKQNNKLSNLAWGTRSENMQDVVAHRGMLKANPEGSTRSWYGGRTSDLRLVEVCVNLVREDKLEMVDIARILDCTPTVAANIIRGRTHKHIETTVVPAKKRRTKQRKAEIRELVRAGKTRKEINELLGEDLSAQDVYYYKTTARKR
jgi:hypothetical protein